jgi:hypothetical protein
MTNEKTYTLKLTSAEVAAVKRALEREYLWNRKQIVSGEKSLSGSPDHTLAVARARTVRRNNKAVISASVKIKAQSK